MIKDRGTIKWTAMMLPEHVEMIKAVWREEEKKSKPILDEQELQAINDTLQQAFTDNRTVHLTYFEDDDYKLITGTIQHVNRYEQRLRIEDAFEERLSLSFSNIIHAVLA